MNKKMKISLILGGMCVALSCGIAIQVRTYLELGQLQVEIQRKMN